MMGVKKDNSWAVIEGLTSDNKENIKAVKFRRNYRKVCSFKYWFC